jgi:hypothetical protein
VASIDVQAQQLPAAVENSSSLMWHAKQQQSICRLHAKCQTTIASNAQMSTLQTQFLHAVCAAANAVLLLADEQ